MLKPVETFTKEGIDRAIQLYGIEEGEVLFMLDSSGGGSSTSRRVAERKVRAVMACTPMSHTALEVFRERGIPILDSKDVGVRWVERSALRG